MFLTRYWTAAYFVPRYWERSASSLAYGGSTSIAVNAASPGVTVVQTPGPGKIIRVLGYSVSATANATFAILSNTTWLSDTQWILAHSTVVAPVTELGWFDTRPGESLVMITSGAVAGTLRYAILG